MDYEQFLKIHLCKNCSVAIMTPHPTLAHFIKCPICGNCKEIKKEENPLHKITNNEPRKN